MSFDLIEKQVIYRGNKIRLEVHHLADEDGKRIQREIVVHPGAVVILPLLPDDGILLIRNRRYAVGQILLELPAGTLEKNEDPMNAAGRELVEEAGYLAGRLRPLLKFYSSPGVMTETMYAFVATELEKSAARPEMGEEIEVVPTTLTEAIEMTGDGRIQDGKSIVTLLWYERFHRGK